MRQTIAFCCLALAVLAARAEVIDIDNAELARLMKSGITVIDIRTQPEWEETGILPDSKLLTFFDERGKADPAAWLAKVKPLASPDQPVIVICRSGNRTKPSASSFRSRPATPRSITSGTASRVGSRTRAPSSPRQRRWPPVAPRKLAESGRRPQALRQLPVLAGRAPARRDARYRHGRCGNRDRPLHWRRLGQLRTPSALRLRPLEAVAGARPNCRRLPVKCQIDGLPVAWPQ